MRSIPILALVLVALAARLPSARAEERAGKLAYPPAKTVEQTDDYHGTKVSDPYRWLEQDVRESPEVRAWVDAENAVTMPYLHAIPERAAIEKRMTELWNYERYVAPRDLDETIGPMFKAGHRYFTFKNDGLQNQSVLYVQDALDAAPRVLLDPNTWSKDGTVALGEIAVSDDGRYLAYGVQDGGSDWRTWHVLEIANGKLLPDTLEWVKFSNAAWDHDSKGFYYGRYDAPAKGQAYQQLNLGQKLYYHRVGTPQAQDQLVYSRPDQPEWGFGPQVTEDGHYLVLSIWASSGDRVRVYTRDLTDPKSKVQPLIDNFDNQWSFVGSDGPVLYFRTDHSAPRGRVVAIDVRDPAPAKWREVIPQGDAALRSVAAVGGRLIATYLVDARAQVRVFGRDGKPAGEVKLPGIGDVAGFAGRNDDPETFFTFQSFTTPATVYRYDVAKDAATLVRQSKVAFDPADYVVEQVFYKSKDGTRVPMFLAHRKDVKANGPDGGQVPTLLYGYGGFNIAITPSFSVGKLAWMDMGGLYAVANLRGGSEYGEEWHRAGTKARKQNVFDDFIAAGEWLIQSGWTKTPRLAIQGGSNGGLLVGAVVNQRPDLWGAALPAVGVMDMLRFQKFTAGRFWTDDYGSSDDATDFPALYRISPYHNLKPGTHYPPILVTTADTDDRVVPGHSFKYAARLQASQAGDAPVLIRIETRAGHGSGKPTSKQIEETTDQWAFLVKNLGMQLPPGYGGAAPPAAK